MHFLTYANKILFDLSLIFRYDYDIHPIKVRSLAFGSKIALTEPLH